MRWWAVQLLVEDRKASATVLKRFAEMAARDGSPFVRLALVSALQRLPLQERWPIVTALAMHQEDSSDANLPFMLWYALEPMVPADYARSVQLMEQTKIPLLRQFISRRISESYMAAK
jgi:hypothetical protein